MKKIHLPAVFLAFALSISLAIPTSAIEEMEVLASNAILIDATYGDILYEQNAYDKAYPASTTKLMTALLVLEAIEAGQLSQSQLITATSAAQTGLSYDSSTLGIGSGDTLSVEDLLHCLMLASANEVANILAIAVAGDIDSFVAMMNSRMEELGGVGTHFTNPHGLHDDNHYTTAYDLALIIQEAISHPLFCDVISAKLYTTTATDTTSSIEFYNTNGLVSPWYYSGYTYSKAIGGKTGYTEEAGYCLVTVAEDASAEELFISVVLGAENVIGSDGYTDRLYFTESTRLLEWGFTNFKRTTIAASETPVAAVPVTLSQETDEVMLRPSGSIERTLPVDINLDDIQREITLFSDSVEAPVAEGDVLGSYTLTYEGEEFGVFDLIAVTSVQRSELLENQQKFIELLELQNILVNGTITFSPLTLITIGVAMLAFTFIVALLLARHINSRKRKTRSRGSYNGKR